MTRLAESGACIGVDLGGSSVKAVAFDRDGKEAGRDNRSFDPAAHMQWAQTISQLVREFARIVGSDVPLGVSAPGLAAHSADSIVCMPGRLAGLERLIWKEYLDWPRFVPVLNDAHAALLGEWHAGAGQGMNDVFMLTLGTGVGGAAIVGGQLLVGHIGRAGHLGHITVDAEGPLDATGTPGSIELAIGNATIRKRSDGRFETTHQMIEAHVAGDDFASQIWLRSVRHLACAVSSLINVLDPEAVIIGGGIARAGEALFAPLRAHLQEYEWCPTGNRVRILPAQLGEFAGAIGAAQHARSSA